MAVMRAEFLQLLRKGTGFLVNKSALAFASWRFEVARLNGIGTSWQHVSCVAAPDESSAVSWVVWLGT